MKAIDLFAGAGGFSTGAKMASVDVVWAANHWPLAVKYHEVNHPNATHACQDLHQADWSDVPEHDIALASPCCQGHSHARGKDRPHHDAQRSTAWAVVSCAEYHRQAFIVVENVTSFASWELFPSWLDAMSRLGYTASVNLIDAADHGVAQNRERLFLVFTRSKTPFDLKLEKQPHVPVNTLIDWDFPKWSQVDKPGRSVATLNRIRAGRARFGRRFVAPYYGSGSGETGRSVHRPIGTITTRDRWAVVDGDRMRMLQRHEVRPIMGFPSTYVLPPTHSESIHLLGNAVCPPVSEQILRSLMARG